MAKIGKKASLLFLVSMCSFLSVSPAEPQKENQQENGTPSKYQQMPPNRGQEVLQFQKAKENVDRLMAEREALVRNNATQEQILAKSAEVAQAQRDAMELFRKAFPQRSNLPVRQFSEAERAEMKALIEKRRELVAAGATHEDVRGITEQIHKIYNGNVSPPPVPSLPNPLLNAQPTGSNSQTSQNHPPHQDQHS